MGIKKSLRNLVTQEGGISVAKSNAGIIDELLVAKNPLWKLTVDTNISASEDLFGKVIGDLQSCVSIRNGVIGGVVNYIDDYTGFSGDPTEQIGNYIALHISVPDETGVTISVSKDGGTTTKALDSDGILIFRITDAKIQKLTFIASKSELETVSKTYALRGLTCKAAPTNVVAAE